MSSIASERIFEGERVCGIAIPDNDYAPLRDSGIPGPSTHHTTTPIPFIYRELSESRVEACADAECIGHHRPRSVLGWSGARGRRPAWPGMEWDMNQWITRFETQ
jgi:hypothetical protein